MSSPYVATFYFFILSLTLSTIFYGFYHYYYYYQYSNNNNNNGNNVNGSFKSSRRQSQSNNDSSVTISASNEQQQQHHSRQRISSLFLNILLVISLSFLWYSVSISFTVYNKWIVQSYRGKGFDYPFTITFFHMVVKYIFSRIWTTFIRPEAITPLKSSVYLKIIVPIGITTALDIGFSNQSISYLTISMYTILKTTVVAWTFIWGSVAKLEVVTMRKSIAIFGIVGGLSLAVMSDIHASLFGVLSASLSASLAGLRWVFVQLLQEVDDQSKSPIVSVYRFASVTVMAMLPLVLIFDIKSILRSEFMHDITSIIEIIELLTVGGVIGCILIIVELKLLSLTSSLTLSIIGELKEIIQIVLGMIAFHDHFTIFSGVGVFIAISSAEYYRRIKGTEIVASSSSISGSNSLNHHDDHDVIIAASRGDFDNDDMELMKLIYDTDEM